MTQVIVLRTFRGKHGEFTPSATPVNLPPGYAAEVEKNGLVRIVKDAPEPTRRQSMPGAPQEKKPGTPGSSKPLGDGPAQAPQSLRVGRARAKTTSKKSVSGDTPK